MVCYCNLQEISKSMWIALLSTVPTCTCVVHLEAHCMVNWCHLVSLFKKTKKEEEKKSYFWSYQKQKHLSLLLDRWKKWNKSTIAWSIGLPLARSETLTLGTIGIWKTFTSIIYNKMQGEQKQNISTGRQFLFLLTENNFV